MKHYLMNKSVQDMINMALMIQLKALVVQVQALEALVASVALKIFSANSLVVVQEDNLAQVQDKEEMLKKVLSILCCLMLVGASALAEGAVVLTGDATAHVDISHCTAIGLNVAGVRVALEPGPAFASEARGEGPEAGEKEPEGLDCPCRDRAALMGALSELFLPLGADCADGLCLRAPRYELHIRPSPERAAVRIAVEADNAAFARSLALSAREVARALDL